MANQTAKETDRLWVDYSKRNEVRVECKRCGGGARIKFPIKANSLVGFLKRLRKIHSSCPEKPVGGPSILPTPRGLAIGKALSEKEKK